MSTICLAAELQPGDILEPGNERVVDKRGLGNGRLELAILPPRRRRPDRYVVDVRHQFTVQRGETPK